jgi:hypothetical protein
LFVVCLGKKTVGCRLNQFVAITNRYDGAGQHPDLDWIRNTRSIEISGLVSDIEINIDRLARYGGAVCEYRQFEAFPWTSVDLHAAAPPGDHANGAGGDIS